MKRVVKRRRVEAVVAPASQSSEPPLSVFGRFGICIVLFVIGMIMLFGGLIVAASSSPMTGTIWMIVSLVPIITATSIGRYEHA